MSHAAPERERPCHPSEPPTEPGWFRDFLRGRTETLERQGRDAGPEVSEKV